MTTHHADPSTSTGSLWTPGADIPVFPPLEEDLRVDVSERTWDRPCHGSRYDRFGTVISGPANINLPPR